MSSVSIVLKGARFRISGVKSKLNPSILSISRSLDVLAEPLEALEQSFPGGSATTTSSSLAIVTFRLRLSAGTVHTWDAHTTADLSSSANPISL